MRKKKRLKYTCIVCENEMLQFVTCEGNVLTCGVCGSSHLLSFDGRVFTTSVHLSRACMTEAAKEYCSVKSANV